MKQFVQFNVVLLTMILLTGCGNDTMVDPGESVEISGVVTLGGKPLTEAEVTFVPADGDQLVAPALVMTDGEGKFIASVNAPREYKVTVDRMMNGAPNPALKAYQGDETTLKANVTKENKKFDFDLK